uniref:Uncharacterized protein n=1 Tax=Arundo donax TaxID=35708 RepID=A0A0A8ZWL9_ARUDO
MSCYTRTYYWRDALAFLLESSAPFCLCEAIMSCG